MSGGAASKSITLMLKEFSAGDKSAMDQVMPLIYAELRRLARNHLRRERVGHTLAPTALVHEAYMRMIGQSYCDYRSRAHFLGIAARVMRQILIDHARTRNAGKRGGGEPVDLFDENQHAAMDRAPSLIAVDDALETLERRDPRKAKLIEMRFFGGLTAEESAEVLDLPVEKVRAELRVAQAWLEVELDRT
jgi:RNA polymerase sigma factor (TIGR02999 family)